jgi:hypothetical protein
VVILTYHCFVVKNILTVSELAVGKGEERVTIYLVDLTATYRHDIGAAV